MLHCVLYILAYYMYVYATTTNLDCSMRLIWPLISRIDEWLIFKAGFACQKKVYPKESGTRLGYEKDGKFILVGQVYNGMKLDSEWDEC